MKQYTVGFLFSETLERVLVVEKLYPPWQRGLFNGVGGKVNEGESFEQCMVRECQEETGLIIPDFRYYSHHTPLNPDGVAAELGLFCTVVKNQNLRHIPTHNDVGEALHVVHVSQINMYNSIPNLTWHIHLASTILAGKESSQHFLIQEKLQK